METKIYRVGMTVGGYKLTRYITETSFSILFVAEPGPVVLKFIKKKKKQFTSNELTLLYELNSRYILRSIRQFPIDDYQCAVLPYYSKGDLLNYTCNTREGKLPEGTVRKIITDTLHGLKYLHSHGIIHRDIKPENIFIKDSSKEHFSIVIGDLGLSVKTTKKVKDPVGTYAYAAPEIIRGDEYDSKVDLWALGVMTFYLLSGNLPFPLYPKSTLVECVLSGSFFFNPRVFGSVSDDAKDFIKHLLVVEPKKRYDVHMALSHPWIVGRQGKKRGMSRAYVSFDNLSFYQRSKNCL